MSVTITKATVIQGHGADTIYLETTLPYAVWPYEGTQSVKFEAAAGTGARYVSVHLGITPEVILVDGTKLDDELQHAQGMLNQLSTKD